jgi:hypothetical protein
MQKWDYIVVQCDTLYPQPDHSTRQTIYQSTHAVYGKKALDPTCNWPTYDWSAYDRGESNKWSGKGEWSKGEWSTSGWGNGPFQASELCLAWSPSRKCWTYLWKCLEDMGEEGWELVGTTPPLSLPSGGGTSSAYHDPVNFCLLFKRPRP